MVTFISDNMCVTQFAVALTHARTCAGCLGNGNCWVCLGTGRLLTSQTDRVRCHRCEGTGLCPEQAQRVIVLPTQP